MVDHLTRIVVDAREPRGADILRALAERGFSTRRERWRLVAESAVVEAQTAKAYLRASGFRDREFRIVLEYVRQWGIL